MSEVEEIRFDFVGEELYAGTWVIMMVPNYRMLVKGQVVSFTPKKVRVKYKNTWNFGKPGVECEILQDACQLVKMKD